MKAILREVCIILIFVGGGLLLLFIDCYKSGYTVINMGVANRLYVPTILGWAGILLFLLYLLHLAVRVLMWGAAKIRKVLMKNKTLALVLFAALLSFNNVFAQQDAQKNIKNEAVASPEYGEHFSEWDKAVEMEGRLEASSNIDTDTKAKLDEIFSDLLFKHDVYFAATTPILQELNEYQKEVREHNIDAKEQKAQAAAFEKTIGVMPPDQRTEEWASAMNKQRIALNAWEKKIAENKKRLDGRKASLYLKLEERYKDWEANGYEFKEWKIRLTQFSNVVTEAENGHADEHIKDLLYLLILDNAKVAKDTGDLKRAAKLVVEVWRSNPKSAEVKKRLTELIDGAVVSVESSPEPTAGPRGEGPAWPSTARLQEINDHSMLATLLNNTGAKHHAGKGFDDLPEMKENGLEPVYPKEVPPEMRDPEVPPKLYSKTIKHLEERRTEVRQERFELEKKLKNLKEAETKDVVKIVETEQEISNKKNTEIFLNFSINDEVREASAVVIEKDGEKQAETKEATKGEGHEKQK